MLFKRNRLMSWAAPKDIDKVESLALASDPLGKFKIPVAFAPPNPLNLIRWWQYHLQTAGLKISWTLESQLRPAHLLLEQYDPEVVYRTVRWVAGFRTIKPFTLWFVLRYIPKFLEEYKGGKK